MSETAIVERKEAAPLSIDEWHMMKEQANMLVKTGFLPAAFKTPEQVVAVVLSGRELGIPPMQALRGIHIIQGTPALKPELMLGLCLQRVPGFSFQWGECNETKATFVATRPGLAKPYQSVFTIQDAQRAGLAGKDNWKHYPGNMLRWRACANALHAVCPDVLVGIYSPDEMGAITDEAGDVVTVEAVPIAEEAAAPKPDSYQCSQCDMKMHDPNGELAERSIAEFGALLCKTHGIAARKYGATVNSDGNWSNEIGIEADTLDALVEQCGSPDPDQA